MKMNPTLTITLLVFILNFNHLTARSMNAPRSLIMRTCPCNMVPIISEGTDVKKVVQKFKEARPRSQRAQLVGFIKQYVDQPSPVIESVLTHTSRVYSDRVQDAKVYNLVQELLKAADKRLAQGKAMLALGKVLRSSGADQRTVTQEEYLTMPLTKLKSHIADAVSLYVQDPTQELESLIQEMGNIYCDRVGSSVLNRLINQLISSYNKETVNAKIMQTLGLRSY